MPNGGKVKQNERQEEKEKQLRNTEKRNKGKHVQK
jgi:hypothetical protein